LRKKLIEDGMPERVVDNYIETRLSHAPKKVGHLEYARVSRTLNYEHNPKKVLPKYMYDSIFRQELAKEFGAKSEVLDNLVGDLKQLGVNTRWVDSLAQLTVGKNPHREAVEQLFKHLNTFQAISKLGYATTVANSLQAPHNIWVRSGFTNLAKSVLDKWSPVKPQHAMLGPAAYSRGLQEEILRAAIGDRSWLGDRYMRWVGFNWSEKMGRHLGAYSGYRELDEMAKTWVKLAPVNKKGADRLLGEIIRKYRIVDDPKDLRGAAELLRSTRGQLPQELLEMGALRASEATMHAFDLMELPTQWRDPFWRMVLQFKSFIYKQTEFMASEVMSPGLNWLASNGARGDIWPMVRTIAAVPAISQATTHLRDLAKSIPSHLWYTPQDLVEGKSPEEMWRAAARRWNYKDPFWEDPDPFGRMMTDAIYIGTLGLVGDMFEAASRGNLADWLLGPTIGEATDVWEAATRERRMGTVMTRWLPGALGIPSNVDIIKAVQRRLQ